MAGILSAVVAVVVPQEPRQRSCRKWPGSLLVAAGVEMGVETEQVQQQALEAEAELQV